MAQYYEGIGRRKESTARVRLTTGSGKMVVEPAAADEVAGGRGVTIDHGGRYAVRGQLIIFLELLEVARPVHAEERGIQRHVR